MKTAVSSFLLFVLLGVFLVGCGSGEPRRATDGADAQAIRDYEAAVEASQQQMTDSDIESEADE
jgi:uncharacterized protein YcfL